MRSRISVPACKVVSFFLSKKKLSLSDQDKLISALEICEDAIHYYEKTIVTEICQYARQTHNYKKSLENFAEAYELHSNQPYLITPSTVELYQKREVFLDLQATLVGENKDSYKYMSKANDKEALTIGEQRSRLGLSNDDGPINALTVRQPDKIKLLKEKVKETKARGPLSEQIDARLNLDHATQYLSNEQTKKTLNKFRDTKNVDGWFWGTIRKLGRLFTSTSQSAKKLNELESVFKI
jgi:hypothetical protein